MSTGYDNLNDIGWAKEIGIIKIARDIGINDPLQV